MDTSTARGAAGESPEIWLEASPLVPAERAARFVAFLLRSAPGAELRLSGHQDDHYRFHVAAPASAIISALLDCDEFTPVALRQPAQDELQVTLSAGPAGPTGGRRTPAVAEPPATLTPAPPAEWHPSWRGVPASTALEPAGREESEPEDEAELLPPLVGALERLNMVIGDLHDQLLSETGLSEPEAGMPAPDAGEPGGDVSRAREVDQAPSYTTEGVEAFPSSNGSTTQPVNEALAVPTSDREWLPAETATDVGPKDDFDAHESAWLPAVAVQEPSPAVTVAETPGDAGTGDSRSVDDDWWRPAALVEEPLTVPTVAVTAGDIENGDGLSMNDDWWRPAAAASVLLSDDASETGTQNETGDDAAGNEPAWSPAEPVVAAKAVTEPVPAASLQSNGAAAEAEVEPAAAAEPAPEDNEARYHIVLGDSCPVCRAVSRISFSADRPPQLPIAGCRETGGCRCSLPPFDLVASASSAAAAAAPSDGDEDADAEADEKPLAFRGQIQVVAHPFANFGRLNQFITVVGGLPGVRSVTLRRFRNGILRLAVDYTGATPLSTHLKVALGEAVNVLSDTGELIEIVVPELDQDQERAMEMMAIAARGSKAQRPASA